MNGYYSLLNELRTHFNADPLVNTVSQGSIFNRWIRTVQNRTRTTSRLFKIPRIHHS